MSEPRRSLPPELRAAAHEPTGIAALGALGLRSSEGLVEGYRVFARTLYYVARGRRERGSVVRQMYDIGNRSLFFVTVVMGFIGMILVLQAGLQIKRVVFDLSMLGATDLELLVRDLAATLCALMLATRVGAGIAAEIGSMVVTEQVDALRMCATDPVDYLIRPRFVASIVMTTVLTIWSAAVAFFAGMITAQVVFDVGPRTFVNLSLVDAGDLTLGLVKCIAYGAAIPVVSGYCGLSTSGGSEGVGWATTRAVVASSLAIIILDFVLSGLGFVVLS